MGWFDEQIRQRKQSDQEVFEDSIFRMASVVLGRKAAGMLDDQRIVTKQAIDDILKYFRYKPTEIPDSIEDPDEQLEYCLRPHGLMRRNVKLDEGWYKDASGPMLAFRKEDGAPVALLPKPFVGYWFHDPATGAKTNLNKGTAEQFAADAICFYRPLPLKKLGIPDLITYLKNCLNSGDYVLIIALTFLATRLGMFMPAITRALTGFEREHHAADGDGGLYAQRHPLGAAGQHRAGTDDEPHPDQDLAFGGGGADDAGDEPACKLFPQVLFRRIVQPF